MEGLRLPASQESAENSPKLQTNLQNQERGDSSRARERWRGVSGPAYSRACLKHCNIYLMGKFEKNSTGFVLVKLTLRIFSSCLGHITLKSRDRLDRLMVLFVIWRMGERTRQVGQRGSRCVPFTSDGVPSPLRHKPFLPVCRPGAEGLWSGSQRREPHWKQRGRVCLLRPSWPPLSLSTGPASPVC